MEDHFINNESEEAFSRAVGNALVVELQQREQGDNRVALRLFHRRILEVAVTPRFALIFEENADKGEIFALRSSSPTYAMQITLQYIRPSEKRATRPMMATTTNQEPVLLQAQTSPLKMSMARRSVALEKSAASNSLRLTASKQFLVAIIPSARSTASNAIYARNSSALRAISEDTCETSTTG